MAETNLTAVAREMIEAFNAGDMERGKKVLAANSVYDEVATQRRLQGPDAIVQSWNQWRQAMPDVKGRITNTVASANTVVQEITWEGTHTGTLNLPGNSLPPTGKRQTTRATQVVVFDGNKVKECRHYFDVLSLLQQLGAVPQATRASGR